jgi:hypothetical protein
MDQTPGMFRTARASVLAITAMIAVSAALFVAALSLFG